MEQATTTEPEDLSTTKPIPRVTICTLTHNRQHYLHRLLSCIEQQTYPLEKIEWLVLDDSTAYGEALELESSTPIQIKYQRLHKKMILGAKRNLSHRLCSGDIIVYMDDDDFYFPQRVQHAVETLRHSKAGIAGCTYLHIYFSHDDQLWLSGPFGKNHATAGTFAMTKEFAKQHFYDKNANCNEEKAFLNNYTIPIQQLNPLQTMICISHDANTYDKRGMRRNGKTKRMQPIPKDSGNALKRQLESAGFTRKQQTKQVEKRSNSSPSPIRVLQTSKPPIALVCGPWGSGTSALCAMIHALGVNAKGPFFKTNDPLTPDCFEMLAFNKLVNKLVDEKTLERKLASRNIQDLITAFCGQYFKTSHHEPVQLQLLKTPACSALLAELDQVFSLRLLVCLRSRKEIEESRLRRGWPKHLGSAGAELIYQQILEFIANSDVPSLFVRHRQITNPQACRQLLSTLANFLSLKPTKLQQQRALRSVAR